MQVFTESTHIVAIRTSGNVYAWEAVEELNIKPRFMKDLLTDQSFTRKDIIHIQDPMNLEASVISNLPILLSPLQSLHRDLNSLLLLLLSLLLFQWCYG